jgi:hypothetical protein
MPDEVTAGETRRGGGASALPLFFFRQMFCSPDDLCRMG